MKYLYVVYGSVCALVIYVIYKIIETWFYMRTLNKLPGPKSRTIIGNVLDFHAPPDIVFKKLHDYSKIYGPIYRMHSAGNGGVFVRDPKDIEALISGMNNLDKSQMYLAFVCWLETGLLTSTDEKWQSRRKILTPTFHFSILQQFCKTFIEHSEIIAKEIMTMTGKPIDVVPVITKCTLNNICETALGVNLHQEAQQSKKYSNAIRKMGELTVYRILRPWYYTRPAYLLSPKFYETLFTYKYLHKYSNRIIKERKEKFNVDNVKNLIQNEVYMSKKKLAMLDMLLYAKANGEQIDDIREEVDTFMFEGHDTTSACACFTLMLLACNPKCQEKTVDELKTIFSSPDEPLTYDALNKMKYLERVIKESLRLYPSVPMIGRWLKENVTTPSGYTIPYSTNVLIRIYDLHRDPEIYPDPEKFDPDRFLPENSANRHPFAYLPFSAGPRNCIGQKFAILELKAILSSILRKCILLPVDTPETITLVTGLILHTKDELKVQFERRPVPI